MMDMLSLTVENTVAAATESPAERGVGLANVKRRLQLLYPDRHQLFMNPSPTLFRVHLIITL